ncbi:MAG: hypothetical protein JWO52_1190, partial [Gammaproteobacteria bacterium]|nr:hypothetical protein [Gammaproteobacteria bacterium]
QRAQLRVRRLVIPAQQLDEQIALAAEVRVERAPRVSGLLRNVLEARIAQSSLGNQLPGSGEQTLGSPIAAVFSR